MLPNELQKRKNENSKIAQKNSKAIPNRVHSRYKFSVKSFRLLKSFDPKIPVLMNAYRASELEGTCLNKPVLLSLRINATKFAVYKISGMKIRIIAVLRFEEPKFSFSILFYKSNKSNKQVFQTMPSNQIGFHIEIIFFHLNFVSLNSVKHFEVLLNEIFSQLN